jgi:hypothetical protein
MVDARGTETDLRHFKTIAFRAEQVFGGNADILKGQPIGAT